MLREHKILLAGICPEFVKQAGPLGLELHGDLKAEDWSKLITRLACNAKAITASADTAAAWLGDILAYKQGRHRGQIAELAKAAGLHPTTLRNAKMVCGRIPPSCRRDTLSWSHHTEIAKAFSSGKEIVKWLDQAAAAGWTRAELRSRIAESRQKLEPGPPASPPPDSTHFSVLRELRAAERLLHRHRDTWQSWSPEVCRLSAKEVPTLLAFAAELQSRAGGSQRQRAAG